MERSVMTKIVVVIMCIAMAAPLFYSMAGGGQKVSQPGLDAVALEKSMRDRVKALVSPEIERDTVLKWSRCIATELVAWFDKTGCAEQPDPNTRDQCLSNAGMEAAHEAIFMRCAESHAPKRWAGLSGAVMADVRQYLVAQKTPAVRVTPLTGCISKKAVATMDSTDCPSVALFSAEGCFSAEKRQSVYSGALSECNAEAEISTGSGTAPNAAGTAPTGSETASP